MVDPVNPLSTWRAASLILVTLLAPCAALAADPAPTLWGQGVGPCSVFLASAPGEGTPTALADESYLRYREWLAGLVTGLNLATGRDVLRGAELDAALLRVQTLCREHPEDDFLKASMRLVRSLGGLEGP